MMRAIDKISVVLESIAAVGLGVMTVILCWQVFGRYVLDASPAWTEQLALVLTIWFVFLGAAAGIQQAFHIRITEGVERLPEAIQHPVMMASEVLVMAFGAGLAYWGAELVTKTRSHAVPTLALDQGQVYAVIPIAGLMMLVFAFLRVLALTRKNR